MCGRLVTADPVANGWELDAIAAVVIGGARLSGGRECCWYSLACWFFSLLTIS